MFIAAILLQLTVQLAAVDAHACRFESIRPPVVVADAGNGADPHGNDPHDEHHDAGLPERQRDQEQRDRQDPRGGQAPRGPGGS